LNNSVSELACQSASDNLPVRQNITHPDRTEIEVKTKAGTETLPPADVLITWRRAENFQGLKLIVPAVSVGLGCRRGTSFEALQDAFRNALSAAGIHPLSVRELASIDLKKDEPGLKQLSEETGIPLRFYSAEELRKAPGSFASSSFVKEVTGVDNVCERAAVLSAGGPLILRKKAAGGVTAAAALSMRTLSFPQESD